MFLELFFLPGEGGRKTERSLSGRGILAEVEAENFYFSNFRNALDLKSALSRTIVLSQKGRCKDMGLTIGEVSKKYAIPADTLRYYEKIGVIPPVTRTAGGIRDYSEDDISWVENAKCMRAAGLSIEFLISEAVQRRRFHFSGKARLAERTEEASADTKKAERRDAR